MTVTPALSIIIANWNGENLLRECLGSILEKTTDISFEIIVVDDASTDRSIELVSRFPSVKLVRSPSNLGFVKTCNIGASVSGGKYLMLLNNDTVLKNNALKILVSYLEAHPETGICGGTLLNPDGSFQHAYGNFPSITEALQGAFLLGDFFPKAGWVKRRAIIPSASQKEALDVDYVVGADLVLRREVYDALGLFDESMMAYCEDTDLCYRVQKSGKWNVVYVPGAEIVHLYSMSYRDPQGKIRQQMRSYDYFLRKHHGAAYSMIVRVLYAWQYFLKMLTRTVRFLTGTGDYRAVKESWYLIRYSLRPH